MILTCPACDTKYVVKDGAIPPGGRKVRCASCKHSWHQDPDPVDANPVDTAGESLPNPLGGINETPVGGPPEPEPNTPVPFSEPGAHEVADQFIAEVPEPEPDLPSVPQQYASLTEVPSPGFAAGDPSAEPAPVDVVEADYTAAPIDQPVGDDPSDSDYSATSVETVSTSYDEPVAAVEDEHVGYMDRQDEETERKRRLWPWLLALLLIVVAGAAAFWFLAPSEWKNRAGIAQSSESPLQLVITSKPDRQLLSSGNELVSVSGKVTNPTNVDQDVPPIQATLRNSSSKKVIHRWTIAPPAKVLAPGGSASFNSAEVDIPSGGDELTISWNS